MSSSRIPPSIGGIHLSNLSDFPGPAHLSSFIHKAFNAISPSDRYRANWHIDAIAWRLEQCLEGNIKRLIVTLPPRNLKSICASVAFPAWALGRAPSLRIICASYANELTGKHARDCRAIMETDWYRRIFPGARIDPTKNAELEFTTTRRGVRLGTSVGGTLTGRGGNVIIIDDPMKPSEAMSKTKRDTVKDWYDGTLYSRLDDKARDVVIVIMQRLHVDDLVGHVLGKEPWVHLNLPAIAETEQWIDVGDGRARERRIGDVLHPEREPLETLVGIKGTFGSQNFWAQYQQSPVPPGGGMIRWDWFRSYTELPSRQSGAQIVQSWDTASKATEISDYSVGTTWLVQGTDYYLIDLVRERLEYPHLGKRILAEHRKHQAQVVLIEDKGSGTSLIQDLRAKGPRPVAIQPKEDKVTRMSAQSAQIEAGHVVAPKHAPWLDDFKVEVMAFPNGVHDDQIDSLSQFLWWAQRRRRGTNRMIKIAGF